MQHRHGAAGVVTALGGAMITDLAVTVFGDGIAARDYVYVDDVVDAFVRASRARCGTTGIYNIGTGQQTTVSDVHRLISAVLDLPSPPCYIAAHTGELHAIALDVTKAEKELGWKATVDLAEGIQRTIRWLRATLEPELEPEPASSSMRDLEDRRFA